MATVEELQSDDDNGEVVAAIPDKKQFQKKKGGHSEGQQGSSGRQGQQAAGSKSREGRSLCWIHEKNGKKARYCADESSCTWSGN